jgi:hypothetical protein
MSYEFDASGKLLPPSAQDLANADADLDIIVFDEGTLKDGSPYWAYIAIKPSKYATFMTLTQRGEPIALEEYGRLIKHGFEAEVPRAVKEAMKQDYGFDDAYITKLGQRLVEAQTTFLKQRETVRISDIVAMLKNQQS